MRPARFNDGVIMSKPATPLGSALVGGLTGLTTALALAIVMSKPAVWSGLFGISAGDWLQAVATIVGIALTVRATMWLEDRKRAHDRAGSQRLLREALSMMSSVSNVIQQPLAPGLPIGERRQQTAAHYELIRNSRDSVEYARQNFRADNYNLWSALNGLSADFVAAADWLRREENIVRGNVTEPMLAISRGNIERFAVEIEAPVRAALAALN